MQKEYPGYKKKKIIIMTTKINYFVQRKISMH